MEHREQRGRRAGACAAANTDAPVVRIKSDPTLVQSAHGFLEAWLVRKDSDAAFTYLSTKSYRCYDLERSPDAPASTSPDDAGSEIRGGLTRPALGSGNTELWTRSSRPPSRSIHRSA